MIKINISLNNAFICKDKECNKIFFNGDDNVCTYCGSKNTRKIFKCKLIGELENKWYERYK